MLWPISAFDTTALVVPILSAICPWVSPEPTRRALMCSPVASSLVGELCPNARNNLSLSLNEKFKLSHSANNVLRFGRWEPFSTSHTVCFDMWALSANSVCVRFRYALRDLMIASAGPRLFRTFAKIYGCLFSYRSKFEPMGTILLRELGQRYGTFHKKQFKSVFF